jgi:hypothetical protein
MWINVTPGSSLMKKPVDVFHFIQTAQVAKAQRASKKPAAKGNRAVFQREALRTGGLATKACAGR